MAKIISKGLVEKIAKLAKIPVSDKEKQELSDGFNTVLEVINKLFKVNVLDVEPVYQVTGLKNVFREDKVEKEKMFSQDQALSNAKRKHNGYFVVNQILEEN